MIRNQKGIEVQTEDYCGWMDEAYKFLHMLTSHNLELLSIYLEQMKPNRKPPPHSQFLLLYRLYKQQQTYNDQFALKQAKLRQLENSIPSALYRRFYGRVSQRVYIKVLFYLFNKRQLSWCRNQLLRLIHLVDSTHQNNFQHFKILASELIAENGKILRTVMGQLIDNNIVSSEQEFVSAMQAGRRITREAKKTNIDETAELGPHQNTVLIRKLNVIARRHQDSNMLCGMWGNFATDLQRDIKENTHDKYNLEDNSPSTFTYNLSKFKKIKRKRISWGGDCDQKIEEEFLKSKNRIVQKKKFVIQSFRDIKKNDLSMAAKKKVEIMEVFAKTEPEREDTECLKPKREDRLEYKPKRKEASIASRHKLNKLKSVSMAALEFPSSSGSSSISKVRMTKNKETTPVSIVLTNTVSPVETPQLTVVNIPKTQLQFSKIRLSLKCAKLPKECLRVNKKLIVSQKFNNGRRVSLYGENNLSSLIKQIETLENQPRQPLAECKQRHQSLISTPRPLYEIWDTRNRRVLKPKQI